MKQLLAGFDKAGKVSNDLNDNIKDQRNRDKVKGFERQILLKEDKAKDFYKLIRLYDKEGNV